MIIQKSEVTFLFIHLLPLSDLKVLIGILYKLDVNI